MVGIKATEIEVTDNYMGIIDEGEIYHFPGMASGFLIVATDTNTNKNIAYYRYDAIPSSKVKFTPNPDNPIWQEATGELDRFHRFIGQERHEYRLSIYGGQPSSSNMISCLRQLNREKIEALNLTKVGRMGNSDLKTYTVSHSKVTAKLHKPQGADPLPHSRSKSLTPGFDAAVKSSKKSTKGDKSHQKASLKHRARKQIKRA